MILNLVQVGERPWKKGVPALLYVEALAPEMEPGGGWMQAVPWRSSRIVAKSAERGREDGGHLIPFVMVLDQFSCDDEAGRRGLMCNHSPTSSVPRNCTLPPHLSRQLLTAYLHMYPVCVEDGSRSRIDLEVAILSCCYNSMCWHRYSSLITLLWFETSSLLQFHTCFSS